jgi:hypothetical protein
MSTHAPRPSSDRHVATGSRRDARGDITSAGWSIGPWPAPGVDDARGEQAFVLLSAAPARVLLDGALITVAPGGVLRMSADEARRLVAVVGRDEVWLSAGTGDGGPEGAVREEAR